MCPHYHAEGYGLGQSGLQIASKLRCVYSDTGPIDPLMHETWGQVPMREWHNSSTDFNLKPSQQRSSTSKQASSQLQDTIHNTNPQEKNNV